MFSSDVTVDMDIVVTFSRTLGLFHHLTPARYIDDLWASFAIDDHLFEFLHRRLYQQCLRVSQGHAGLYARSWPSLICELTRASGSRCFTLADHHGLLLGSGVGESGTETCTIESVKGG